MFDAEVRTDGWRRAAPVGRRPALVRRWTLVGLTWLWTALGALPTDAQESPSPTEGAPALQEPTPLPSVSELRARRTELSEDPAPTAAARLEALDQALASREASQAVRAEIAELRAATAAAPARIAALAAELAEPPDESLPALDQLFPEAGAPTAAEAQGALQQATAEVQAAHQRLALLEEEAAEAEQDLRSAAERQATARAAVDAAADRLEAVELAGAETSAEARLAAAADLEHRQALLERLTAARERLEAERELRPLQRASAQRARDRAQRLEVFWRTTAAERSRAEADEQAARSRSAAAGLAAGFPTLAALAEGNIELRSQHRELLAEHGHEQVDELRRLASDLRDRAAATQYKVRIGGLTEGTGLLLRREFEWLREIEPRVRSSRSVRDALSRALLQLELVREELEVYGDSGRVVAALVAEENPVPEQLEEFRRVASELAEDRRSVLHALDQSLRERTRDQLLEELNLLEDLVPDFELYDEFVSGRILWVPSTVGGRGLDLADLWAAVEWLLSVENWRASGEVLLRRIADRPGASTWLLGLVLALFTLQRRLRRRIRDLGDLVRSYRTDAYSLTLRATLVTVVVALPIPVAFWVAGWIGRDTGLEAPLLSALATGLMRMVPVAFALEFLRSLARVRAVGEVHFRWPPKVTATLRRNLLWFEGINLPAGVLYWTLDATGVRAWNDTLGRMAFVVSMLSLVFFSYRVLSPAHGVLADAFERDQGTLLYRTRKFWFAAAVGVPAALSLLALLAYYYTALQLELRLEQSVGLTLLLVLVNGLLLRWLFVTRRRLAVEQARTRSASDAASSGDRVSESGVKVLDEDRVDIPAVDSQTRQLFRSGITLSALVGLYLIWASALPALGGLERIQVWPTVAITEVETDLLLESFSAGIPPAARNGATGAPSGAAAEQTGERGAGGGDGGAASNSSGGLIGGSSGGRPGGSGGGGSGGGGSSASSDASGSEQGAAASGSGSQTIITLADVALTAIVLLVVTIAAKNIPGLLEISLLQRLPLDSGARFAVTTLVRYLILVAGISAAFGTLGVSWEKVQWLAAALTFGLAFGLQEIFANFVSGIIILLERPVRIGDIVTVAGTEGRVTRLAMRATTIMDWDRRELLVPNKEFITGSIVNWTLSDQITRLRLDVGVAYGSDVDRARQLMLRAAKENRDLLDDPPPRAWFLGFGDSALSLRLLAFLPTRDVYLSAMDRLHSDIDRLFREAGIEISFPQRDLHLRSAPGLEQLWARQGRRFGTDAADEPADEPAEEAADDRDRPPPKPGPRPR